jgi:WD40 repeat protein
LGIIQFQKAALHTEATRAEAQLNTDPVAGLVTAIRAMGQNRSRLPWTVLPEVESSLLNAVQTARERNRFELHSQVDAVAFSPDAQQIAAATADGNVSLWNRQGHAIQTLIGDGQEIGSLSFSPDGAALLANAADQAGSIQFWNLSNRSPYHIPTHSLNLTSAAFSSDGQMLIGGNANGRVQLWSQQGDPIAKLRPRLNSMITAVAFDGPSIVSGDANGRIALWNTKGDRLGQLWAGASIEALTVSQAGQRIISQDRHRQQAFLWNQQTQTWNQFLLGETQTSRSADLSPDNSIVATGDQQGQVHLAALDGHQNFLPQALIGHGAAIHRVRVSPDNQTVLSGDENGSLRLWDLRDGILLTRYHLQEWLKDTVQTVALSSNGEQIAVSGSKGRVSLGAINQQSIVQFPDVVNPQSLTVLQDDTIAVQTHADASNRSIMLSRWSRDGKQLATPVSISSTNPLRQLVVRSDRQLLLSISQTGLLQLWDSQGRALSQPIQANPSTQTVQFSPNGQQVISSGSQVGESQTCLWQVHANQLVLSSCQAISSSAIAFTADGDHVALGAKDGKIAFWNLQTNQLQSVQSGNLTNITAISWRPDGYMLAVGQSDGKISLFDRQGRAMGQAFAGHQSAVQNLAFRAVDQSLVSISRDGEVRLWHANGQAWLQTACNRLRFHPVLQNVTTSDAAEAKAICQQQVWSANTASTASTTASITSPTPPVQPAATSALRLIVKLGERRVYLYRGNSVQTSYPIAVGQSGWETPTGTFKVFEMLQNPAWTHPLTGQRIDPGQQNPLSNRWMAFWSDGYHQIGFHGTPDRNSVGKAVSHGCLRMYDEDAQALYEQIKLGTVVTVEP